MNGNGILRIRPWAPRNREQGWVYYWGGPRGVGPIWATIRARIPRWVAASPKAWCHPSHVSKLTTTTITRGVGTDLIHRRVRLEMQEFCVEYGVLRSITNAFTAEGFVEGPPVDMAGQRRSLFATYENNIDWTDQEQVGRAVRVFEDMLTWGQDNPWFNKNSLPKIRRLFEYDGYLVDDQLHIGPIESWPMAELPLDQLRDPSAIREYLDRLTAVGDNDPPLAISYAKSLIESTTKLILEELGQIYDAKDDLPSLAKSAQEALKIHPETVAPTKKGRQAIVIALGNLSQIAIRVAELRNEYGIAHGQTRATYNLGPRHAHLVVGMAIVYCRFLIETLLARRSQPLEDG